MDFFRVPNSELKNSFFFFSDQKNALGEFLFQPFGSLAAWRQSPLTIGLGSNVSGLDTKDEGLKDIKVHNHDIQGRIKTTFVFFSHLLYFYTAF